MIQIILLRIQNRLNRILHFFGLNNKVNQLVLLDTFNIQKRVLFIAFGEVEIPPIGWGAVEQIIWEQYSELKKRGWSVSILNSKSIWAWSKARKEQYDFVINHNDALNRRARSFFKNTKLITYSHYGYIQHKNYWSRDFKKTLRNFRYSDYLIALNPKIMNFLQEYYGKKVVLIPNGTNFGKRDLNFYLKRSQNFVCVGKVEERKQQLQIFEKFKEMSEEITFFGKIVDPKVKNLLSMVPTYQNYFPGELSKKSLIEELLKYKCLVLLSKGEADALVLYEAQMLGLQIIVNEESKGSQVTKLPWVHVIDTYNDLPLAVQKVKSSTISPIEIRNYALENYSWDTRINPLLGILKTKDSDE